MAENKGLQEILDIVGLGHLWSRLKEMLNGKETAGSAAKVQGNLDTHTGNTANPHKVTKAQVGLGAVDNTSDADKPVSTAQAAAIAEAKKAGTDAQGNLTSHNTDTASHNDLRIELKALSDRIAAVLDSDDETLDELSEIVAYIKSNKSLIDAITTSKVSYSDIVNDLVTNVANKPLSAAQGVALKKLIDDLAADLTSHTGNKSNPHGVTAAQVGLGNVPNVSTNNQTPTYTAASSPSALTSGEKLSAAFAKIAAAVSALISHLADTTKHITAAERTAWNSKAAGTHKHTKSEITDFPSSMPASDVYAWAKAANKPEYTADEVGAVSKNGGTMTSPLTVEGSSPYFNLSSPSLGRLMASFLYSNGNYFITNRQDDNNYSGIIITTETTDLDNALRIIRKVSGTTKYYNIFGEHNKPAGTYTGTNSTTTQTIDTGGTGDVILVQLTGSGGGMALVSKAGAICKKNSDSTVYALSADKAKFIGGVLTLATNDYALNRAYGYNWQVL